MTGHLKENLFVLTALQGGLHDLTQWDQLLVFWILSELPLPPPSPQFGQLVQLFLTPKTPIKATLKTTHYPKGARCQIFGQGPPPPAFGQNPKEQQFSSGCLP